MKKIIITLITGLTLIFNSNGQSLEERLSKKYNSYLLNDNLSVTAMIVKNGDVTISKLGKSYNGNRYDENSIFNIGSATKTMTSVLILQEIKKGSITLKSKIEDVLEPIPNVDGSLTIEDLLRHESGLGELYGQNALNIGFIENDSITMDKYINSIPEPYSDKKFRYTNTNYILLGKILESVTGMSYYKLLEERIFNICGMKNTYPSLTKKLENVITPVHKRVNVKDSINYQIYDTYAYSAGSVASTLLDMQKFYETLFETDKLLDREYFKALTTSNVKEGASMRYCLGLIEVNHKNHKFYSHGGDNIGYSFKNYYDVDNKNYVLLVGNEAQFPLVFDIQKDLLNYIKDKDIGEINTIETSLLNSIVGDYSSEDLSIQFSLMNENGLPYIEIFANKFPLLSKYNSLQNGLLSLNISLDKQSDKALNVKFQGKEITVYRKGFLPKKSDSVEDNDFSSFVSFSGSYVVKEMNAEVILTVTENNAIMNIQNMDFKLTKKDNKTLVYSAFDIELSFDLVEHTITLKQKGNQFRLVEKNKKVEP